MKIFYLLLIFLLSTSILFSQNSGNRRFGDIPLESRAELKRNLEIIINYYRVEDWGGIYDFLFNPSQSKGQFIESKNKINLIMGKLINFNPIYNGTLIELPEHVEAG